MDDKKVLYADFENRKPAPAPNMLHVYSADKADAVEAECRAAGRTTDDLFPETDNPVRNDAGVRIREYAITPGRVLRTLEKVTGAERAAGNLRVVR